MPMTPYEEIYDLFMQRINDYQLVELFESSEEDFKKHLQGYLILAIADFPECKKDLDNRDDDEGVFNVSLSTIEKVILAKLMIKQWFVKHIQNVVQFEGKLTDKDFKTHSEAQNLTAKQNYFNVIREEVDQDKNDYGYRNAQWLMV